jgi:hypothetical protein
MSFSPYVVWPLWIAFFAVFEGIALYSKRKGDTLSEATQQLFATRTLVGRVVFAATWLGFTSWFMYHILVT